MNPGTRFESDGRVFFVTSDEHAGTRRMVKAGDVLTSEGVSYVVGDEGDEVTLIEDGAGSGTGQTVHLDVQAATPVTRTGTTSAGETFRAPRTH